MGWLEIVVVAVVALLVLGPKRLPAIAHFLGRGYRLIKGFVDKAHETMEQQAKISELDDNIKRAEQAERDGDKN